MGVLDYTKFRWHFGFSSSNIGSVPKDPDPFYGIPLGEGAYKTICKVPGYLLNSGTYSISVYIGGDSINEPLIIEKDILSFNINDSGEMRKEFLGKWEGVVRPRLQWVTKSLD